MGFTQEDLKEAIGKDGIQNLKDIVIDKGTAFLSNKITSTFTEAAKSQIAANLTNSTAVGVGIVATANEIKNNTEEVNEIIQNLAQKIILKATENVTKEATALVADYAQKHLREISSLPGTISSYTMSKFNEEKMSVGDAIKELTQDSDERIKKYLEEREKEQQKSFISGTKEKLTSIINEVNKYTTEISSKIGMVANYMQEGPDWVVNQLDKQCQSASKYIHTLIDTQWAKDKQVYDDFAKGQGEAIGSKMAAQFNAQLKHSQKKLLDKQSTKLNAAITKTKTSILGSALSLAAKTGLL